MLCHVGLLSLEGLFYVERYGGVDVKGEELVGCTGRRRVRGNCFKDVIYERRINLKI